MQDTEAGQFPRGQNSQPNQRSKASLAPFVTVKVCEDLSLEPSNELRLRQAENIGSGGKISSAGVILGQYLVHLAEKTQLDKFKNILEIGSGTGVAGLLAAALGKNVILSDLKDVRSSVLDANIEANEEMLKENEGSAKSMELDFKDSAKLIEELKNNQDLKNIDLILCSDLLFSSATLSHLPKV